MVRCPRRGIRRFPAALPPGGRRRPPARWCRRARGRAPARSPRRAFPGSSSAAGRHHGSCQSPPAIARRPRRTSSTRRAMGPSTCMSCRPMPGSGSPGFQTGTRPRPGRMEARPQACAGCRSDPPRSLPCASGLMPVASAAAAPPLDPPGVWRRFQGLRVAPKTSLLVSQRQQNSGVLLRPMTMAPASSQFCTQGDVARAMLSRRAAQPLTVAHPRDRARCP